MTREREIEILMKDGCTRSDAEKHLKNGTVVFDDFEENFEKYMEEWNCSPEQVAAYKDMVNTKKPVPDWGVVEFDNITFYIMYSL